MLCLCVSLYPDAPAPRYSSVRRKVVNSTAWGYDVVRVHCDKRQEGCGGNHRSTTQSASRNTRGVVAQLRGSNSPTALPTTSTDRRANAAWATVQRNLSLFHMQSIVDQSCPFPELTRGPPGRRISNPALTVLAAYISFTSRTELRHN